MDVKQALEYIESTGMYGSKPGLERVGALLEGLGRPQDRLKYVHVAGTNGKGSVCAMLASVLKAAGYKTGLFTSPYIFKFNERMQINGESISDEALADLVEKIKPIADAMDDKPTEFELITAAALQWYADECCDIVILEVGLGGRLDATNIIPSKEAAVIMNIGLDHTEILGDTVEKIAAEKAGIIVPGCDCVLYGQQESVQTVVAQRCNESGVSLYVSVPGSVVPMFDSLEGQAFSYKGRTYALSILGANQRFNAAVAIEAVCVLRSRGWKISDDALEHGLYSTSWPARFELVSDEPCFIVDGGHNPQCAGTVAENLKAYFPGVKHVILAGVLRDKDYESLFSIIDPQADEYVCIQPDSPRALPAQELGEYLKKFGKPVTVCSSIPDGVELARARALELGGMGCAVGSLYMAGQIRDCFGLY